MGRLTTVFGTAQGLLFAVGEGGAVKRGFPVRFNAIHMAPVCVDLAGDGYLEIVAAVGRCEVQGVGDMKGVLAVLDDRGEEVWYRVLSGALSQVRLAACGDA